MAKKILEAFVDQLIASSHYEELDRLYLQNRVLALVGQIPLTYETELEGLIDLKDQLVFLAQEAGQIGSSLAEQEILASQLMDLASPSPSQLNREFWTNYQKSPDQALAHFYQQSQANDYIKIKALSKNIAYRVASPYGDLEITINLAKPEKDPKEIAAAKKAKLSDYPPCQLCFENEGYLGRLNHPARSNHRIIRLDLQGETWGFQYSPYAYFKEHCIFLAAQHRPMKIDRASMARILELVELFPGYFVGSNADLPIVGGSILSHDHYQGGRHCFPMEQAPMEEVFRLQGFEKVKAGIVAWPMSVIRLQSKDKEALLDVADKILTAWQTYSDPQVGILAESKGEKHHTINPIARLKQGLFELDLVLRDNQTSSQFPDGIYHPHPDVQHIKKENIGLIEVMGLAILPPRLKEELKQVEAFLLGESHELAPYHRAWAQELKAQNFDLEKDRVQELVRQSVGQIFCRVLEDAGVYKRDPQGRAGFRRFIESLGGHLVPSQHH
ncbi:UDP-glucose--hexose-1-phosphate uridylyltransferase [Streptococcus oricebi]|uniref:Galactose-1-phosphate uridylyltransferase n=1 Tax=Streptococcus oricebi TaxID=1547447 RepID=A0ABS5B0P8_9STRE|nr:UDP-glucose--hexose-1-phosphate uridylyltransferase [Streptococcus oricebi]MBP2622409.1 UDP-glucose--hexose-1-phosphate uridylyltransferase [Streptococcus oricebi]